MPDAHPFSLQPEPFLGGFARDYRGVSLREHTALGIVSAAFARDGEKAARAALKKALGLTLPEIGRSRLSGDGDVRLLRLGADQIFVLIENAAPGTAADSLAARLGAGPGGSGGTGLYLTDQSDVWVTLKMQGEATRRALERICPLDLHPDAFPVGAVARTVMEHLGTIILRSGEDAFWLLSASSSAGSFLHAVETSILNTEPA